MTKLRIENVLRGEDECVHHIRDIWTSFIDAKTKYVRHVDEKNCDCYLISDANWAIRGKTLSCQEMGIRIRPGDICYIDYGQAYLNEIGFQHFGLVIRIYQQKAFVVPMTSNEVQYNSAYDPINNPSGKRHLMRLGWLPRYES
ncbi:hypothetical protein [Anaerorhabdus sp.]|uniref:hypothetical protein n=1 Tax=Anaerorhabdus sp. TaxID=1872524 RepID=UPI002FCC18F8